MIRKIISGADRGVELAALDLALRLGISCSGWSPRKVYANQKDFQKKYCLRSVSEIGYKLSVEKNIQDSNGLLLITRGEKIPKTQYAVQMALKHHKQLLHVDLHQYSQFEAASLISSWLKMQKLNNLYITGTNTERDRTIYRDTQKILETAFYLDFVKSGLTADSRIPGPINPDQEPKDHPQTVAEAVARLKSDLTLKDRTLMANMQPNELDRLIDNLGEYIKQTYGLYTGNERLMQSCAQTANLKNPLPDEACHVILRALWRDLKDTHKLRIVK
jgi:hypothetical protein